MKKFSVLALMFLLSSCLVKNVDDPLIVPSNFAEMPDVNNPEKPTKEEKDENVARLKDLLLKSDN